MAEFDPRQAAAQSQAARHEASVAKAARRTGSISIVIAFAVGLLVATSVAVGLESYSASHTQSSSPSTAPAPPSSPTAGTYWHNSSVTGEATDLDNIAWFDFNVSCPTGNMILKGVWYSGFAGINGVLVNTSSYGAPAILQISSGGTILVTQGNESAHELGQSTFGSFDVIVHENVTFKVGYPASDSAAVGNPQWAPQVIITGEADSWSVIL